MIRFSFVLFYKIINPISFVVHL